MLLQLTPYSAVQSRENSVAFSLSQQQDEDNPNSSTPRADHTATPRGAFESNSTMGGEEKDLDMSCDLDNGTELEYDSEVNILLFIQTPII